MDNPEEDTPTTTWIQRNWWWLALIFVAVIVTLLVLVVVLYKRTMKMTSVGVGCGARSSGRRIRDGLTGVTSPPAKVTTKKLVRYGLPADDIYFTDTPPPPKSNLPLYNPSPLSTGRRRRPTRLTTYIPTQGAPQPSSVRDYLSKYSTIQ